MTRDDLAAALRALDAIEQHLDSRVEIWRVIVDEHGHEVRRVYRGSFTAPPDWQPPSLDTLLADARGRREDA